MVCLSHRLPDGKVANPVTIEFQKVIERLFGTVDVERGFACQQVRHGRADELGDPDRGTIDALQVTVHLSLDAVQASALVPCKLRPSVCLRSCLTSYSSLETSVLGCRRPWERSVPHRRVVRETGDDHGVDHQVPRQKLVERIHVEVMRACPVVDPVL